MYMTDGQNAYDVPVLRIVMGGSNVICAGVTRCHHEMARSCFPGVNELQDREGRGIRLFSINLDAEIETREIRFLTG